MTQVLILLVGSTLKRKGLHVFNFLFFCNDQDVNIHCSEEFISIYYTILEIRRKNLQSLLRRVDLYKLYRLFEVLGTDFIYCCDVEA